MRIMGLGHSWRPEQSHKIGYLDAVNVMPYAKETSTCTRVYPGTIVVLGKRRAYRVNKIKERPLDLWPERFHKEWERYTKRWVDKFVSGWDTVEESEKETWSGRPLVISVRPADQPEAEMEHYLVQAERPFYVLPEHYSVCRVCNEVPPCTHITKDRATDQVVKNAERLLGIPPGFCLGCGEKITSRMKAVRFPGPNLWRPDMPDGSAVFHERNSCNSSLMEYEREWVSKVRSVGREDGHS